MPYLRFFVYPVVGSFLGFITNFIAIKLLFRPKKKVIGIQGLLPKRKMEIARRAGDIVNSYLVNSEELRKQIDKKRLEEAVERYIERHGGKILDLPLVGETIKKLSSTLLIDRDGYFNRKVIEAIIDEDMVSGIVRQKISEFDVGALEQLVKKASGPELRFILLTGAVVGILIGLAQALIGL
jgi:uncharacterized membrane protein YheB (UPF0754 family)